MKEYDVPEQEVPPGNLRRPLAANICDIGNLVKKLSEKTRRR